MSDPQEPSLGELLAKDPKLDEVLAHSHFLEEINYQNQELFTFLARPE